MIAILATAAALCCGNMEIREKVVVREAHQLFAEVEYTHYQTDHFWNKNGKKMKAHNHFKKNEWEGTIEYGINYRNTLGLKCGFAKAEETVNGNTMGVTDGELYWDFLVWERGSSQLGTELKAIIPLNKHREPGLRYGRFGTEAGISFQNDFIFLNRCSWFYGFLGYRWYCGFPSDQIRNKLQLGIVPIERVQITFTSDLDYGLFNGKKEHPEHEILFASNYRLLQLELKAILRTYKQIYLFAGYFGHTWGNNVGTGQGFNGGIYAAY